MSRCYQNHAVKIDHYGWQAWHQYIITKDHENFLALTKLNVLLGLVAVLLKREDHNQRNLSSCSSVLRSYLILVHPSVEYAAPTTYARMQLYYLGYAATVGWQ